LSSSCRILAHGRLRSRQISQRKDSVPASSKLHIHAHQHRSHIVGVGVISTLEWERCETSILGFPNSTSARISTSPETARIAKHPDEPAEHPRAGKSLAQPPNSLILLKRQLWIQSRAAASPLLALHVRPEGLDRQHKTRAQHHSFHQGISCVGEHEHKLPPTCVPSPAARAPRCSQHLQQHNATSPEPHRTLHQHQQFTTRPGSSWPRLPPRHTSTRN
jgi:hypothetical protein